MMTTANPSAPTIKMLLVFIVAAVVMKEANGTRFYITPYGECTDCQGTSYKWCWVGESWQYCSQNPGHTTRNEKCTEECNFHGYSYLWCKTETSWDYCSWIEESTNTELSSNREPCHSYCDLKNGNYQCKTGDGELHFCSPVTGVTSLGTGCSFLWDSNKAPECGSDKAEPSDCCFTFTNPASCDPCSSTRQTKFFPSELLQEADVSIVEMCMVRKYNGDVVWMKQQEVSYALFGEILVTGLYVERREQDMITGTSNRTFLVDNENTFAEGIKQIFHSGDANDCIKKSKSMHTSNYGTFEVWTLEMNNYTLAQVNVLTTLESASKTFHQRLLKRAMYYSLTHGEIAWIFQKRIMKGAQDELECPAEGHPYEDRPAEDLNQVVDGAPDKLVITSLDRVPFITNANYKPLTSEEKFAGVLFEFPTSYPIECDDPAWTMNKLEKSFADIGRGDLCLRIKWRMGGYDTATEVWSIANVSLGCIASPNKAEIRNCHYPIKSREKMGSENYLGSIDLENIPEINTTLRIRDFLEKNYPVQSPMHAKFVDSLYDPCLEIYMKGKPVIKIELQKNWIGTWLPSIPQYHLFKSLGKSTSTFVFIMPCFLATNHSWVEELRENIITHLEGFTVITLRWTKAWNFWPWEYTKAVATTQDVGNGFSRTLQRLRGDFPEVKFWGVGFGLGSHTLGRAGRDSGVFNRITGLDPSGPAFESSYLANRLTQMDADFVDVVHSSAKMDTLSCNNMADQNSIEMSNPFGNYGISLKSGHLDFFVSPCNDMALGNNGKPSNPFGMDSHLNSVRLFIQTVSKPRLIETDMELMTPMDGDQNRCKRGGQVAEMGFHANPAFRGSFYVEATVGETPLKWPSRPLSQQTDSEIDCRDLLNPRVTLVGIGAGFFKKIKVHVHVGGGKWKQLYEVYVDLVNKASVITIHELQPSSNHEPETSKNDAETTKWILSLCSHGLPDSTERQNSELLPDLFYGRLSMGNKPESASMALGKEALISLPKDSWKNHIEFHQMVPASDFGEENKKRATRLFINRAPQLATLYHSIWTKLEEYIRDMATRRPLKIFTLSLKHSIRRGANIRNSAPTDLIKVVIDWATGCKFTFIVDNSPNKAGVYDYLFDYCPKKLTDLLGLPFDDEKRRRFHCFVKVTPNVLNALKLIEYEIYAELKKPNDHNCWYKVLE